MAGKENRTPPDANALWARAPWLLRWLKIPLMLAAIFIAICLLVPLPSPKPFSRIIEDRHGIMLSAALAPDDRWRLRTDPAEIPDKLKRILIRKEDRFFYYHPGINPFAIVRAAVRNIRSGRSVAGASTITMQVARMLEPKPRTLPNKMLEMFRAFQLELRYSKKNILEMYLSMVPYGGNIEGLKSAALLYYQTPVERLNIARLLDLIIIPKNPNVLRPDRFPDLLLERRRALAISFRRKGFITAQDSSIAWDTPAASSRFRPPQFAPQFCLRFQQAQPGRFTVISSPDDGRPVRSSLDWRIQQTAESMLSSALRPWKQCGVNNGAVIIVRNDTREVLAYVGTENFYQGTDGAQVDAVRAVRSPGSTLKPFLVALAMDDGTITGKSRLIDVPYDVNGYTAENYDGTFSGYVTVEDALKRSLNVPMIHLLSGTGIGRFTDLLQGAGFAGIARQRPKLGLSMITGGCGVTLEELAAAYAAFPAGGAYRPLSYEKRRPAAGNDPAPERAIFSASAAYMVTDILASKSRPDLPNNFESSLNLPAVAFKTGTSYGRRDAWAMGYSADYTIGVWIGNVDNVGNADLSGTKAAAPLLIDLFNTVSTQYRKSILPQPSDVLEREVCSRSGLVPSRNCTDLALDLYSLRHTLERRCDIDTEYIVSSDGKEALCMSCVGNMPSKSLMVESYPPELVRFWASRGRVLPLPPPHNPACTRIFTGQGPHILAPQDGMIYYLLSPKDGIGLEAASGLDVREHIWYIDDKIFARVKAGEKTRAAFGPGPHTISCMDEKGRLTTVAVTIKSLAASPSISPR